MITRNELSTLLLNSKSDEIESILTKIGVHSYMVHHMILKCIKELYSSKQKYGEKYQLSIANKYADVILIHAQSSRLDLRLMYLYIKLYKDNNSSLGDLAKILGIGYDESKSLLDMCKTYVKG